jgi:hypothetical protein
METSVYEFICPEKRSCPGKPLVMMNQSLNFFYWIFLVLLLKKSVLFLIKNKKRV